MAKKRSNTVHPPSKSNRKRSSKEKTPEIPENHDERPPKRIDSRTREFLNAIDNIPLHPQPSPDKEAIEVMQDIVDTSNMKYTLSTVCLLGGSQIFANTEMPRLGEFNFRHFNVEIIKKVDAAARKSREEFEYESGNAQMSAKGINKSGILSFQADDEQGWSKVETFVEEWMKQLKRDIHVKLTMCFKRMKEVTSNEHSDSRQIMKKVLKQL